MTPLQYFLFLFILIIVGVLLLRYLDGSFNYNDTIIEKNRYKVTKHNFITGLNSEEYVYRYVIRRDWQSGKIEFVTKEVKI